MYLTYEQYQEYGGTLDQTTFDDYNFEATTLINYYTFGRLVDEEEVDEAVKRCCYKLICLAQTKAKTLISGVSENDAQTASIASQSNDGVSISYNVMSAVDIFETCRSQTKEIIQQYLSFVRNSLGQRVLYRGIYPHE